jgi:hypothetical protein
MNKATNHFLVLLFPVPRAGFRFPVTPWFVYRLIMIASWTRAPQAATFLKGKLTMIGSSDATKNCKHTAKYND